MAFDVFFAFEVDGWKLFVQAAELLEVEEADCEAADDYDAV